MTPPRSQKEGAFELFNLGDDPNETKDLASERPEVLARLRKELNAVNAEMVAPRWGAV